MTRRWRWTLLPVAALAVWSCPFDISIRNYLQASFWAPFPWLAKMTVDWPKAPKTPYAGMAAPAAGTPMNALRERYRGISGGEPEAQTFDRAAFEKAVAAARAKPPQTLREREELDLIDAKIDMRGASAGIAELRPRAKAKFEAFLKTAKTPEWRSEARGWLAHICFQLGDQTCAGKTYLDELERKDSNINRDTLLVSLYRTYRKDNVDKLLKNLEAYFDTPKHAAFAITVATSYPAAREAYQRIPGLLEKHRHLFSTAEGALLVAELGMRAALSGGDPKAAVALAAQVPANAPVRTKPEFLWLLGSAQFLSRSYADAEEPLVKLFDSKQATPGQRRAAAYGLCGVYAKTGNRVEQIRMALAMQQLPDPEDLPLYWTDSGFDLAMLLEAEAPIEALQRFLDKYPKMQDTSKVRYALATRLARENRFDEAAAAYAAVPAPARAARMRKAAAIHREAATPEGSYRWAEFLSANSTAIYFNDRLWEMRQRYALTADTDTRLSADERKTLVAQQRELQDSQEEYWRAYKHLDALVRGNADAALQIKAAQLAIRCLRRINTERFGREEEIAKADLALTAWLKAHLR